ncbi:uncharacterized protein TNCV_142441 [Trichonephila clavipes]|nr:uncharacterized protein TNCV_142441 [Trichonephila clavipes]
MNGGHGQWNGTKLCLQTNHGSFCNKTMVGIEFGDTVVKGCVMHRHTRPDLVTWFGVVLDFTPDPLYDALPSGRGKKIINSTVVEEVATSVQEESSGGLQPSTARGIARALDRPVSMVHKILLSILHCYPYKISHVQELLPPDLPVRETFAFEFLVRIEVDNEWP